MKFPTIDEFAKGVAEKALDEVTYEGKTIREWAEIITKQQPCEDCISRSEALKHTQIEYDDDGVGHKVIYADDIEDLPSVTPQPKVGKWIKAGEWSKGFGMGEIYGWFYECSECSKQVKGSYDGCNYNYCPYCGSDNRDLESLGKSFADGYEDGLEEK
jgi:hypothetical protein